MSRPLVEKIKTYKDGDLNEISGLLQRIQKINIFRYSLRLSVLLWAAYMLFGHPNLGWIILFALFIPMFLLDNRWRKLIRDGIRKYS